MMLTSPVRPRPFRSALALVAVPVACAVVAAGCSSSMDSADGSAAERATTTTPTTTTAPGPAARDGRSDTPAATFAPLTGGTGPFLITASTGPDLAAAGYTDTEYAAAGTAVRYTAATSAVPTDGRMQLTAGDGAAYATRVLVRRPADAADFNGTLVVEWLNVSSGADVAPDYTYLAAELVRQGYAWAGVSAQRIGIEGGAVAVPVDMGIDTGAGKGIKNVDPERYGSLSHPGDAFAYDIFTQVSRGLRTAAAGTPLDGLDVRTTLAIGESQSGYALTTYANGVQPLTQEFDGILIHSRGGASLPLGEPGAGLDMIGSVRGTPTIVRTDLDVPVIVVETESDVLGVLNYYPARQPDSERIRVWEIAGTAHADRYQVRAAEPALGCSEPINDGQQVFVLRSALRSLATWAAGGDAAPSFEPLQTQAGTSPTFVTDDAGNARGGVRTPAVDAPTQLMSGLPAAGGGLACLLMGRTRPLAADVLAARYPDAASYTEAYAAATDSAIDSGAVLADDRAEVIADARPGGVSPKRG